MENKLKEGTDTILNEFKNNENINLNKKRKIEEIEECSRENNEQKMNKILKFNEDMFTIRTELLYFTNYPPINKKIEEMSKKEAAYYLTYIIKNNIENNLKIFNIFFEKYDNIKYLIFKNIFLFDNSDYLEELILKKNISDIIVKENYDNKIQYLCQYCGRYISKKCMRKIIDYYKITSKIYIYKEETILINDNTKIDLIKDNIIINLFKMCDTELLQKFLITKEEYLKYIKNQNCSEISEKIIKMVDDNEKMCDEEDNDDVDYKKCAEYFKIIRNKKIFGHFEKLKDLIIKNMCLDLKYEDNSLINKIEKNFKNNSSNLEEVFQERNKIINVKKYQDVLTFYENYFGKLSHNDLKLIFLGSMKNYFSKINLMIVSYNKMANEFCNVIKSLDNEFKLKKYEEMNVYKNMVHKQCDKLKKYDLLISEEVGAKKTILYNYDKIMNNSVFV